MWLGGKGGPRLLRLAARHAAGWNTVWRVDPGRYAAQLDEVRAACEAVGRDPATFRLTVGLYGVTGETDAEARAAFERGRAPLPRRRDARRYLGLAGVPTRCRGTPRRVLERVAAFEALGVEQIVLSPWVAAVRRPRTRAGRAVRGTLGLGG